MMEGLLQIIQNNVDIAPYIIFGALLLAGFNLPVSEDLMLFISAYLASENPEKLYILFAGVYLGAYLSDLICYWMGRKLGPKLWNIRFFKNMVDPKKVEKISSFYARYGMLTLILGRFIPFGVRNGLFLTAGLGKMNFAKFAFSDWIACTISNVLFFTLYYHMGKAAMSLVKKGNIVIFSIAGIAVVVAFIYHKRKKKLKLKADLN